MPFHRDEESNILASCYESLLESRREYLRKIEEVVISHIQSAESLLDVGAGRHSHLAHCRGRHASRHSSEIFCINW